MTSGSIAVSTDAANIAGRLDWWESDLNAAANTSVVNVSLYAWRTNSGTTTGTVAGGVTVAGTYLALPSSSKTLSYNSNTLLGSVSYTATHGPDGAAQASIATDAYLSRAVPVMMSGSAVVTLETLLLAPSAPSALTVTRASDTQQNLSWTNNAATRAPYSEVRVARWDNVSGSWADVAVLGAVSSWSDTATVADRRYGYRVRAVNSAGESSSTADAYVYTTPATPTSVTAAKAVSDITVTWGDSSSTETGFEVWHAANGTWDGTALATVAAGVTTYTHVSPSASVTHTYRVRAVAGTLTSAYGTSNTVALLAAPNAPTNLSPTTVFDASAAQVFSWTHNPVDSTAQTAYELQYRIGTGSWTTTGKVTSTTSSRTFAAGTLTQGQTYEWQVRTYGQHATASPWSASATVRTSARPVAGLTTPGAGAVIPSASLSPVWTYSDPEGSAQSAWTLTLYQSGTAVWTTTGSGAATTAAIGYSLANGGSYTVGVKVRDGDGLWSPEATRAFTVAFSSPLTPELTATVATDTGSVTLAVTNPANAETYTATDFSAWPAKAGVTYSGTGGRSGGGRMLIAGTGAQHGTYPPLSLRTAATPGVAYEASVWIRSATALPAGRFRLFVTVWTSAWTQGPLTSVASPALTANVWTKVVVPSAVPAGYAWIGAGPYGEASLVAGETVEVSDVSMMTAAPAVTSNLLYRDGVPIATIPANGSVVDRIPTLGVASTYTATAWSATPSSATSTPQTVTVTSDCVWLNGGAGWAQAARAQWSPSLGLSFERAKTLRRFVASAHPVEYAGQGRAMVARLGFRTNPDDALASGDAWATVADLPAPLCLRTPDGRRYWVSAGSVEYDPADRWTAVSVSLTQVAGP